MRARVEKYFFVYHTSVMDGMVYLVDFFGRSGFFAFIMMVYMFLWQAIYGGGEGTIAGFSLNNMIWYLVMTEIITLSNTNYYQEVSEDVKTGNVAYLLNKPFHYIAYCFSNHMGKISVRLLVNCLVGGIVALLLVGANEGATFRPDYLLVVVVSLFLGVFLNYFLNLALALSAFWVEENAPFRWIYSKLVFTLGGMLIPLEFFPKAMERVASYLPFAYVTYGPGKLAVKYTPSLAGQVLLGQVIYLGLILVLCVVLYKRGVKKLNVNGG